MQLRGYLRRMRSVWQYGKIEIRIDAHRLGDRLMIEADVVEDQHDLAMMRRHHPRLHGDFLLARRRHRKAHVEGDETPDENRQEAGDRNEREKGDRPKRVFLARRQPASPLPSDLHASILNRQSVSPESSYGEEAHHPSLLDDRKLAAGDK